MMRVVHVDSSSVTEEALQPAIAWLRDGRIVAFPTDTLYGLAVDPRSPSAVRALFDLKGRSAGMALPLIAASPAHVEALCGPLGAVSARLAAAFWPGPLSLVLDAPASITPEVHAWHHTVAIRVPAHALAQALTRAFGAPLTATSANRTGEAATKTANTLGEIANDDRVLVIDGGPAPGGPPSTIVDARGSLPVLVREGAIAWDRVLRSIEE
jgi:L-threonylcarbamoyladenylate synthase